MNREFPERPIAGIGAVVIKKGAVLLVRRGQEPHKGEWTLPGGLIELGEPIESAVRREVREETGIRVKPVELLAVFERIIRRRGRVRFHYVVLDYFCRPDGGRLRPASDVTGTRWVRPGDFPRYRVSAAANRIIRKALARVS